MEIATILPTKYLGMREDGQYNMCLAHLMNRPAYRDFFREQSRKGFFVLMDNGVVETDEPLKMEELIEIAEDIGATEMVLPDAIRDKELTLERGREAMDVFFKDDILRQDIRLMAVPQGSTKEEWRECVLEMLEWPVASIGISRFVNKYYPHRLEALLDVPELIDSDKEIHLLGCAGDPKEMFEISEGMPKCRIRGVDSGIAAIYTQEGVLMESDEPKPLVDLDFDSETLDEELLSANVEWWEKRCLGEK